MSLGDLTEAERQLKSCAAAGTLCDFGEDDPAQDEEWGEERTIRSSVLYSLCCTTESDWSVHAKGVRVRGARIDGALDFEDATLRCPLRLISCRVPDPMVFRNARVPGLTLSGSQTLGLLAKGIVSEASIEFGRGFLAEGTVDLSNASVRGDLICSGGSFENPDGHALSADGLDCKGDVVLQRGFSARGEVRLLGATILGDLACNGGSFENPEGNALSADRLDCKGGVFLRRDFSARGAVRLPGATIGSNLECDGGSFENPEGNALFADDLDCKGSVFLRRGFSARGAVRLPGATIGSNLECDGGSFENPEGNALFADRLDCKGSVLLRRDFSARGEVRLLGATIIGDLACNGGSFENPEGDALSADRLDCKGSVFLGPGFSARGAVRLLGATIGSNLECTGGSFEKGGGDALTIENASVAGAMFWRSLASPLKGALDLTGAHAGAFCDDVAGWPESQQLMIDGFRYDRIDPIDFDSRRAWLQRAAFSAQPYEQLAAVMRTHGHEAEADSVLMAKQWARLRFGTSPWYAKLGNALLGVTVGHGYRPGRALLGLVAVWLFGWWLFGYAHQERMMAPTNTSITSSKSWQKTRQVPAKYADYPAFSAAIYSMDTLLPVIRLNMESYWAPSLAYPGPTFWRLPAASWVWGYLRLHIALGWILSTLTVLAFTGIVRGR